MSEDIAISVQNLSKKYIIGHQKKADLRHALGDKLKGIFNTGSQELEEFWALKDINFEVKKGEAVGIIGRNGAGKSTLLKILSRITEPTSGRIEINGRVSSLLEVGTGFHPELSGRENIFLNGTILGMRRAEIKEKFDEIVAFSGVEKFIDTPVKHYSSGMKVRLAFSVAAHLEPEILIVDEVLAVGDAEFQKKCLGKIDEVSKNEGRTVIFVSHNLAAVTQLCTTGILLRQGQLVYHGDVNDTVHEYISYNRNNSQKGELQNLDSRIGNLQFQITDIKLYDSDLNSIEIAQTGKDLILEFYFSNPISNNKKFALDVAIQNDQDVYVAWIGSGVLKKKVPDTFTKLQFQIPKLNLVAGNYYLTFYCTYNKEVVDYVKHAFNFTVEDGDFFGTGIRIPKSMALFYTEFQVFYLD